MTPLSWLAVAAGLVVSLPAEASVRRVGVLAGGGRLVAVRSDVAGRAPPWRWLRLLAGVAAVAAAGVVGGPWLGIAGAAVLAAAWVVVRGVVARREAAAKRADLLAAVRVMVAELEAGAGPAASLEAAAHVAPRHAAVLSAAAIEATRGRDAAAVLTGDAHTRALGSAWRLGEETGAALGGVLGRVAGDLSAADEQRRAVAVALAGPRASAALLTGLPLVGIAMGTAMGARPLGFLTSAPAGRVVCCAGVLLDVAGVLWMRRLLRNAEGP